MLASRRLPALALLLLGCPLAAQTRLLRFPDLHGDQVVFTYAGDLWKAPLQGGTAVHLTSSPGVELFAKFSPDGRWIAFTGQLDGDEQVYVMPSDGGEPRQLTFYPSHGPLPDRWGYDNQVYGWAPDSSAVLFRSLQDAWTTAGGRLYTVAMPAFARQRGALPVALPMPYAGAGEFAPDGLRIVYSPLFRDFRTWKRYEGGWAQDLFVFDPATGATENISNHPRTDRDPMWIGDRIWFASDRSGTLNLWSYDPRSKTVHQETSSTTWDVRWPSSGGPGEDRIVYEKGGELYWYDCRAQKEQVLRIRVPDEGQLLRTTTPAATDLIEGFALSPGGRRTVFAARGELSTVPKEHGSIRNLTQSPGAHDKHPAWSPDGSTIAFVSDRTGEEQIWLQDHLGEAAPRQLTKGLAVMLYQPAWSPDGKWLAFGDKDGVLRTCAVATGELTAVADDAHGQILDAVWSPCSGHLAFSMSTDVDGMRAVFVYSLADRSLHRVSRPLANDRQPVFDLDGKRLFCLGLRGFAPRLAQSYEWDFQVDRAEAILCLALQKDLPSWLPLRSDEATAPADAPSETKPPTFPQPIAIDFDGLADRAEIVPVALDNFGGLAAVRDGLLYVRRGGSFYGRETDRPATLHIFSPKDRKETQLGSGIDALSVSPDRTHVLWRSDSRFTLAEAAPKGKDGQQTLDLQGLPVTKVPTEEYAQIFHEVWRRYRDFFYTDNLHGHDWEALRERYLPLVAHVRHRSDLNYVLGEMIAELNVGHAYISGGDTGAPPRPDASLPGVKFRFDAASGRYRLAALLPGENDDPMYRSPATAVGTDLRPGDYLLAIDGKDVTGEQSPYELLRHRAGRPLLLQVNTRPQADGARTVQLQPIASEDKLRYLAWVTHNRERTATLSGGKLGYIHLPDMGQDGIREFIKQYYPQRDKQGLVLDDRWNGGGNVSQMVLNRLQRQLLMCTFGRTTGYRPYPQGLYEGHLVCLLNETSASDGDIFPAMFRRAGLGKLVGKRSWGGIIGITNRGMLMDGGTVNVPEFGNTEPGGQWTIEGHGVDPDIVVENDVQSVLQGRDPQLEKAVEVVLEQIRTNPRPAQQAPPAPVKTGR